MDAERLRAGTPAVIAARARGFGEAFGHALAARGAHTLPAGIDGADDMLVARFWRERERSVDAGALNGSAAR